ncbi:hypothetical protein [Pasteuria penetrans]|uniref:hypothetical protein n=1 Tax=Pasteuria penetrans TaxID=86005 RepID=UPI000FA8F707|nr:hypothetical protein [Pasteuria penetrans]
MGNGEISESEPFEDASKGIVHVKTDVGPERRDEPWGMTYLLPRWHAVFRRDVCQEVVQEMKVARPFVTG